jgi:hypothetical protein
LTSIDRTAYPRFKRSISAQELRQAYSPSLEEMEWARGLTDTDDHLLSLVVWLKCCQRLGYFPSLAEIPVQIRGVEGFGPGSGVSDVFLGQRA